MYKQHMIIYHTLTCLPLLHLRPEQVFAFDTSRLSDVGRAEAEGGLNDLSPRSRITFFF